MCRMHKSSVTAQPPNPPLSRTRGKKGQPLPFSLLTTQCTFCYERSTGCTRARWDSAMLIEKCSLDIVEQSLCCALQCSPDTGRPLEGNRGNMCPPLTTRTSQLSTIHFENHDNRDGGLCVFFNHFRCHTVIENQKLDFCLKPSPI